ncbi:hypothetical protein, partial [Pararhodobacter sp.]|uniref:hypothetical protein n=1 Tax=Pararhodobacter sp. TaxID=2127056 RepID=UPI002AFF0ED9
MVRVRMLRPHLNLMKGEVAGFPPDQADDLIKRNIAVAYDQAAEAARKAEQEAAAEAARKAEEEAAAAEAARKAEEEA